MYHISPCRTRPLVRWWVDLHPVSPLTCWWRYKLVMVMLVRFINPVCAHYWWTFKAGIFATSAVNFSFPQLIPIIVFLHAHMKTRITVFNSSILSHRWQTIQYHTSTTWTEEQGTSVVSSQAIPTSRFWSLGDACWRGVSIYYHTVKCRSRDDCADTSSKSIGILGLPLWTWMTAWGNSQCPCGKSKLFPLPRSAIPSPSRGT